MCTQLKIHDIKSLVFLVPEVSLAQFYFLFDGPGMSFVEGIVCPQASQTCCDKSRGPIAFSEGTNIAESCNKPIDLLVLNKYSSPTLHNLFFPIFYSDSGSVIYATNFDHDVSSVV